MAVDLSTIHHEGAGAPCTIAQANRCYEGGYSYAICTDGWVRWRSPQSSYATKDFNHRSLDMVLTGNRMDYEVTDADIAALHGAFMDCYQRGEVTAGPQVRPHRYSPGSSTVCPGDRTMARWDDVANAVMLGGTPPQPKPPEDENMDLASAINHDGRPVVVQVGGDGKLYLRIRNPTGGGWSNWRDVSGGFIQFDTVTAWQNPAAPNALELWVTMKDGRSYHRWQTGDDLATWSEWRDVTT